MTTASLKAEDVRNAVVGNWLLVLNNLVPNIAKATEKPGRHIACPVHGGKDGFKLFHDADRSGGGICNTCGAKPDGFALLMWIEGWNFHEALTAVADVLGISSDHNKPVAKIHRKAVIAEPKVIKDPEVTRSVLRKIWRKSMSLRHPDAEPARLYLQHRGLDSFIPDWYSVRFHPNMQYKDENFRLIGYFPAMIFLIENGSGAITIHRTFLTSDGLKAPVDCPKKMMEIPSDKVLMGSAIRLGAPGRVLSVTEGFETALAVFEATGMVTWPLINSAMMSAFIVPNGVEKLIIWSDLDRSNAGYTAAKKLAERANAQGVEVVIREPKGPIPVDAKSVDWLDVLNQHGPNAFSSIQSCF